MVSHESFITCSQQPLHGIKQQYNALHSLFKWPDLPVLAWHASSHAFHLMQGLHVLDSCGGSDHHVLVAILTHATWEMVSQAAWLHADSANLVVQSPKL